MNRHARATLTDVRVIIAGEAVAEFNDANGERRQYSTTRGAISSGHDVHRSIVLYQTAPVSCPSKTPKIHVLIKDL